MGKYKILALDGGGSRGILTSAFLHQLERNVGALQDNFDLVVGTSTGGIIAAALGKGLNTGEILALYDKEIPNIFSRTMAWKIKTGFGVLGPKYDSENLSTILFKYLENKRGSGRIRFITTCYNTDDNDVILLDSNDLGNGNARYSLPALYTSLAPTFFPSENGMIDGGIYANNPVLIGLTEALKLGYSTEDIVILNVGTGYHPRGWNTKSFGIKEWLMKDGSKPLLDMMFDAMAEKDSYIANKLLGDNYFYANVKMDKKYPMDVVDRGVLNELSDLGEWLYYENKDRVLRLLI